MNRKLVGLDFSIMLYTLSITLYTYFALMNLSLLKG
jgi:hypothetical protein